MKKQNLFQRIWDAITFPFVSIAIVIDEDRRQNLDGQWDKYWERKNRKLNKKEGSKHE